MFPDRGMDKEDVEHIYNGILLLKRMKYAICATCRFLEVVTLSKVSKTKKEKYCVTRLICGIQKEVMQMNLFTKQKQTHKLIEQIYSCQSRRIGGKRQEVWVQYIHTALFTMDKQQEPSG